MRTTRSNRLAPKPEQHFGRRTRFRKDVWKAVSVPPFDHFPSSDAVADTRRFLAMIEAHVRQYPAQYLWAYQRFRREGFDPYRAVDA